MSKLTAILARTLPCAAIWKRLPSSSLVQSSPWASSPVYTPCFRSAGMQNSCRKYSEGCVNFCRSAPPMIAMSFACTLTTVPSLNEKMWVYVVRCCLNLSDSFFSK